jgi:hypothetical protein
MANEAIVTLQMPQRLSRLGVVPESSARLGVEIASEKIPDRGRVYRIA